MESKITEAPPAVKTALGSTAQVEVLEGYSEVFSVADRYVHNVSDELHAVETNKV